MLNSVSMVSSANNACGPRTRSDAFKGTLVCSAQQSYMQPQRPDTLQAPVFSGTEEAHTPTQLCRTCHSSQLVLEQNAAMQQGCMCMQIGLFGHAQR